MLGLITTGISLGVGLIGANKNAKAAQKAMRAQATADTASRKATAASMIASVNSQNAKVKDLERMGEIMTMQGKADAVIRKESYNDTMAMAMVMGAVSGRTMGEGSINVVMDQSASDHKWDQLWAKNSQEISEAALYQDMETVYQSGSNSLMLGGQQLEVARLGSQAGQANTAAAAQQAFNNTLVSAGQSVLNNYGGSLLSGVGSKIGGP